MDLVLGESETLNSNLGGNTKKILLCILADPILRPPYYAKLFRQLQFDLITQLSSGQRSPLDAVTSWPSETYDNLFLWKRYMRSHHNLNVHKKWGIDANEFLGMYVNEAEELLRLAEDIGEKENEFKEFLEEQLGVDFKDAFKPANKK